MRGVQDGKIRVIDQSSYLLVPDFFADDIVLDPAALEPGRGNLPTENTLLGLADAGNAIIACVWRSNRQSADVTIARTADRLAIADYRIDLPKDKSIWLAVLDGPGIWKRTAGARPAFPFPAKWRSSLIDPELAGKSRTLIEPAGAAQGVLVRCGGQCAVRSAAGAVNRLSHRPQQRNSAECLLLR